MKETTEKPPCKIKRKGVGTSKISPPKKAPSLESKNKGGAKTRKGLLIKQVFVTPKKNERKEKVFDSNEKITYRFALLFNK